MILSLSPFYPNRVRRTDSIRGYELIGSVPRSGKQHLQIKFGHIPCWPLSTYPCEWALVVVGDGTLVEDSDEQQRRRIPIKEAVYRNSEC